MATLTVKDFSCIENATLDLGRITILVGPQSSGKSIISKLVYFINEIIHSKAHNFDHYVNLEEFKSSIYSDFVKWFPISAWGSKKFFIKYASGDIEVLIERKKAYRKPSEKINISFSSALESIIQTRFDDYKNALTKITSDRSRPMGRWEIVWDIRKKSSLSLNKIMGDDFVEWQMFIPAGRAFFTSFGKAISAFDHSGLLDPATLSFGRTWASIRDQYGSLYGEDFRKSSSTSLISEIFGGQLLRDRDQDIVVTNDGRRVPMSALSSGQQELLPLWLTMEYFFGQGDYSSPEKSMLYIEEPEAHLFPQAQSNLIKYIASKANNGHKLKRRVLITTHSPYVLSTLNNLVKASNVSKKSGKSFTSKIEEVIPSASWLKKEHVKAYAIIDNCLFSIQGKDGIIDGQYLDKVSDEIIDDFNKLLDIEYG